MAAPSYTEDLTDVDLAEATTNWAEPTASGWTDGSGGPDADADWPYIQGNAAISQQMTKASVCGMFANNGSGITLPTDGAYFVWGMFANNKEIDTYANGGQRVMVGSGLGDFYSWDVGGSDMGFYPYGGWQNFAVNTTVSSDDTAGTPTSTEQYIGHACKSLAAISKGNQHIVDAIRYGRGSSIFEFGDLGNGYCTFQGFADTDETDSNRWGLARTVPGGFLWKGRMQLGTATNAVDFRDSDASIVWDETPKVTANFNVIEINNASSRVDWTNVVHRCTSTVSPTRLVVNANMDMNWDLCQFYDMGALSFGGTTGVCTNAKFQGCGQIEPNGADLTDSEFSGYEGTSDTGYVNWDVSTDPNGKLDNCSFTKGTASTHAIEFDATNSPTTMTLVNHSYSGYNAANGQTDSTIYFKRTSGTVTVNYNGDLPRLSPSLG
jgi:hypothetical protein